MRIYDDKEKRQENVLQNVSISYESRNFHYPVADAEIDEGSGSGPPPSCGDQTERVKKALIVTGPTLIGRGLLDGVLEEMEEQGLLYVIYNKVEQNPTDENVEDAVKVFLENGCDCMLALGGGAPLDCAKAVGARIARPNRQIRQLQGLFRVVKQIPMLFAVPTTAGSGSETTISAVITDTATHHKAAINDLRLMPKYAVLDPELTLGLPPDVTAMTGMDALCHAVEAYTMINITVIQSGNCAGKLSD